MTRMGKGALDALGVVDDVLVVRVAGPGTSSSPSASGIPTECTQGTNSPS